MRRARSEDVAALAADPQNQAVARSASDSDDPTLRVGREVVQVPDRLPRFATPFVPKVPSGDPLLRNRTSIASDPLFVPPPITILPPMTLTSCRLRAPYPLASPRTQAAFQNR